VGLQECPGFIGGPIVVDEIAVHELVIVTKKERQYPFIVPALRIEMNHHAGT
jgi:hypothetical protein